MAVKRLRLVSNWRQGHKFWSNRILAAVLFLIGAWPALVAVAPQWVQARLPAEFSQTVIFTLTLIALLVRFIDQGLGSAAEAQEGGGDDAAG